MLFEKASLRTWTTFEIAVRELGGNVVALQPDIALDRREAAVDVARSLERWVDAVDRSDVLPPAARRVRRGRPEAPRDQRPVRR